MYQYKATVSKVIDGDTIHALVDLGFKVYTDIVFRLSDINAPERFTSEGKIATAALTNKILHQPITVDSRGKDKYGRWLATIYHNGENINHWLLSEGYAAEY